MKITKAVIPVAGMGTRFLPATKAFPKEMFPIVNVPILEMLVLELVQAGITDILFVISSENESIIKHFNSNYKLEKILLENQENDLLNLATRTNNCANIFHIVQNEMLGFADAVSYGKTFVNGECFVLCVGDELIKNDKQSSISQLIECYNKYSKAVVALYPVIPNMTHKYGIADIRYSDGKLVELNKLIEKPKDNPPSNLAVIGKYIMHSSIFDIIHSQKKHINEVNFMECLNCMIQNNDLNGMVIEGTRFDTGDKLGYVTANIEYGLQDNDISTELKKFLRELIPKL